MSGPYADAQVGNDGDALVDVVPPRSGASVTTGSRDAFGARAFAAAQARSTLVRPDRGRSRKQAYESAAKRSSVRRHWRCPAD